MMKKTISVLAIAALVVFSGFTFTESFAQFVFAQTTNSTTIVNLTNSTLSLTNSTNITTTNSTLTTTNSTTTTEPIVPVEETFTVFQEQQQQQQSFPIISQQPSVDLSDLVYETYTDDFIIRSYQNYDEVIDLNERVVKVISTPLRINTGDSWGYIKSWEDINNLYIQSIKGAITLDKNACAFTMYDGLEISPSNIELGSISWSPRYAQVGTDDWIVIDELNDAQCTVVSEQIDDYNLVLTLTKDTSNFRLEHLIEINSFEGIKETYRIFNDNPLLTNHKFSAIQTIHVPNTITIPMIIPDELTTIELPYSEDYDFTSDAIKNVTLVPEMTTEIITTNGTQTTTIPQFYKVEYTPYIATSQTFDIESLSFDGVYLDRNWIIDNHLMILGFGEHLSYDIEKGLDQLWSINLFNENSIPKVSLDYANNAQLIPVGGVFEVDPTFYNSYSTASTTPTQVSVPVGVDVTFKVWGAGGGSGRNGGGGGGGYSGIFSSNTLSQATAIVVGGAGGGGTSCGNTSVSYVYGVGCAAGGSGGGTTAMAGYDTTYYYGGAGSQTAGGAGHTYSGGTTGASGTALGGGSGSNNFSTNTSTWGGGVGGAGGYISGTIDTTNLPEANLYVLVGGGGGAGGTSGTYTGGVGGVNGGGAGGIGAGGGGAGYYGGAGGGSACCGGYGTGGGGSNFYNTNFVTIGNNLIGGAGKANTARTNDDLRGQLATVPPLTADTDWSNNGGAGGGYTGTASNGYDGLVVLSYAYVEVPDPPANFAANDGTPISVTYSAPAYDGGSSVYGYNIYRANAVSGIALPNNGGSNGGLDFTDNELLLHEPNTTTQTTSDVGAIADGSTVTGMTSQTGLIGNGLYNSGSGYVNGFNDKEWTIGDNSKSWTYNMWFNRGGTAPSGNSYLIQTTNDGAGYAGTFYWYLTSTDVNSGSGLVANVFDSTNTRLNQDSGGNTLRIPASYFNWSNWNMVTTVWDSDTNELRQYVNNVLVYTSKVHTHNNAGIMGDASSFNWCAFNYNCGAGGASATYASKATNDEWAFWNRELTTQEISDLWNSGSGALSTSVDCTELRAYYNFEQGASTFTNVAPDSCTGIQSPTDSSPNNLSIALTSGGSSTTGVISNAISAPNLEVTSSLLPDATDSFTVGSWVKQALTRDSTYDGTANGGVTTGVTGKVGNAWSFDGVDDYVDLGTTDLISGTGDWTVSVWAKPNTVGFHTLLATYPQTNDYDLYFHSNGKWTWNASGDQPYFFSTGSYSANTWYHLVVTKNNGVITYYKNGATDGSASGYTGTYDTRPTRIGQALGNTEKTNGLIDDMSIWSRALSSTEVGYLYNSGNGKSIPDAVSQNNLSLNGLKAYYDFEQTGTTLESQIYNPPTNTKLFGFTNANGDNIAFNVGTTTADFVYTTYSQPTTYSQLLDNDWTAMYSSAQKWGGIELQSANANGVGDYIGDISYWVYKFGSPTGNIYAYVLDSNNNVMATSTNYVDIATLGTATTGTKFTWTFDGTYQLQAGDKIVIEHATGNNQNYLLARISTTSTYDGSDTRYCLWQSGWNCNDSRDFKFTLNENAQVTPTTIISATGLTDNTSNFQHYAITRDSNNWTLYQNGASVATATDSSNLGSVSGTSRDSALDGTKAGATVSTSTGKVGTNAWDFSGTGTVDFTAKHNLHQNSQYSIAFWLNVDTYVNNGIIFDDTDFSSANIGIGCRTENTNQIFCSEFYGSLGSNYWGLMSTTGASTGTWYHYVITVDSGNVATMYRNGQSVVTDTTFGTKNTNPSTYNFRMGDGANGNDNNYDGKIDQLVMYDRILSGTEISDLYNLGSGTTTVPTNGLVAHWDFEQTGTTLENQAYLTTTNPHTINIDGSIDEYFIDSTALTSNEIVNTYDRGEPFVKLANPNNKAYAGVALPDNAGSDSGSTGQEVNFVNNEYLLHYDTNFNDSGPNGLTAVVNNLPTAVESWKSCSNNTCDGKATTSATGYIDYANDRLRYQNPSDNSHVYVDAFDYLGNNNYFGNQDGVVDSFVFRFHVQKNHNTAGSNESDERYLLSSHPFVINTNWSSSSPACTGSTGTYYYFKYLSYCNYEFIGYYDQNYRASQFFIYQVFSNGLNDFATGVESMNGGDYGSGYMKQNGDTGSNAFQFSMNGVNKYIELIFHKRADGTSYFTSQIFADSSYTTPLSNQNGGPTKTWVDVYDSWVDEYRYFAIGDGYVSTNGAGNDLVYSDFWEYYYGVEEVTSSSVPTASFEAGVVSQAVIDPKFEISGVNFPSGTNDFTVGSWVDQELPKVTTFDGTAVNNPSVAQTGVIGNSWAFDGSNDYVTIPTSVSSYCDLTDCSVSAWIKLDTTGTTKSIIGSRDNGNGQEGWIFRVNSANTLTLLYDEVTNQMECNGNTALSTNTWYHVAFSYDYTSGNPSCSMVDMYVNGASQSLTEVVATITSAQEITHTQPTLIGINDVSLSAPFDGNLDQILVYSKALSQSDITTLYGSGSGTSTPDTVDLVAHYDFEQTGGTLENQSQYPLERTSLLEFTNNAGEKIYFNVGKTSADITKDVTTTTTTTTTTPLTTYSQTAGNDQGAGYGQGKGPIGEYVPSSSSTLYNKYINEVSFWCYKVGSPTGDFTFGVWNAGGLFSGSGNIGTLVHTFDVIDVSTIPTGTSSSYTKITGSGDPYQVQAQDLIGWYQTSGFADASNFIGCKQQNTETFDGTASYLTEGFSNNSVFQTRDHTFEFKAVTVSSTTSTTTTSTPIISATNIASNDGTPRSYAFTRDGNNFTIYQDGSSVATATNTIDFGNLTSVADPNYDSSTISGSITKTNTGKVGNAWDMNNGYIEITPTGGLSFTDDQNFAIGIWAYREVDSGDDAIYRFVSAGDDYISIFNRNSANGWHAQAYYNDNSGDQLNYGYVLSNPIDSWHHYVFTKENGVFKYYIDGSVVYTFTDSGTFDPFTTIRLSHNSVGDAWEGKLDEFFILDRVLNNSELELLSRGNSVSDVIGADSDLIAYYDFEETTGGLSNTDLSLKYKVNIQGSLDEYYINSASESATTIQNIDYRGEPLLDYTTSSTSFNDQTVVNGETYQYKATALNTAGESNFTQIDTATTAQPPDAPTGLVVSTYDNDRLDLSWTAPAYDGNSAITGYKIQRESPVGNGWVTLIADTGNTATTYSNTILLGSTQYNYRVAAINTLGVGSYSNEAANYTLPDAPTSLSATAASNASDLIALAWSPVNGSVSGYLIERESPVGGGFTTLVANYTGGVTYNDTGLTENTTFNYRVAALGPAGTGVYSSEANATTLDGPDPPSNVTGVISDPDNAPYGFTISWTAPNDIGGNTSIVGYGIQYSENGGSWTQAIADTGSSNTSANFTVSQPNTNYSFRVKTIGNVLSGDYSTASANVTTPTVPNPPANVTLTQPNPDAQPFQINVAWDAPADDGGSAVSQYTVYRSTDDVVYANVTTTSSASYLDTVPSVPAGNYFYKVSATNAIGYGGNSTSANFTVPDLPDPPTLGLTIDNPDPSPFDITVAFTLPVDDGGSNVTAYNLYSSPDDVTYTLEANATTNSSELITVSGEGTWYFKAQSISNVGTGSNSTAYNITTPTVPDPPTLSLSIDNPDPSPFAITVAFTLPVDDGGSNVTAYNLYSSPDDVTFTLVANATTNNSEIIDVGSEGTWYFKAQSINNVGTGSNSTSYNITTPTTPGDPIIALYIDDPDATPFTIRAVFSTPDNGGSLVNNYNLYYSSNNSTFNSIANSTGNDYIYTVNSVGAHYFKAEGINNVGVGTLSQAFFIVTPNPPDAPSLSLSIDNPNTNPYDIRASFVPPAFNGGSAITGYNLYYSSDNVNYSSLINGTTADYTYTVGSIGTHYFKAEAVNNVGVGFLSTAYSQATPVLPNAPTGLSVIPRTGNTSMLLSWTAPTNNGGSNIDAYLIERQLNGGSWSTLVANTGNALTTYTDSGLSDATEYGYRVSTITSVGTGSPSNVDTAEFSTAIVGAVVESLGGNTIRFTPLVNMTQGIPDTTVTNIWLKKSADGSIIQSLTPSNVMAQGSNQTYSYLYDYPQVNTDYYIEIRTTNGEQGQSRNFLSNTLSGVPLAPFDSESNAVSALEVRNANYTGSILYFVAEPVGFDMVVKYQHQDSTIPPFYRVYEDVEAAVNQTSAVSAGADYYISLYYDPTFTYSGTGSNSTATIPLGYPSDLTIRSLKSPDAQPQLGLESMGDLFGLPMVFLFVIAVAAIFTGRSAPMGILIIGTLIGVMVYLGYISFDFDLANGSDVATWAMIIVAIVMGIFVGKRWD